MRIEKFSKIKDGMYKLRLDNGKDILVHEDLLLKKELLLTREINDEDVKNIDKLNNNYNAYDLAVKYIGVKFRSCFEVYDYLEKNEVDKDIIHNVIEKLKSQKYLDDFIFAKSFVSDRIRFSNKGPYKIKKELYDKGVSGSIVEDTLVIFDSILEKDKLNKLVPKYVKTIRNKSYTMMKNKVCEYFSNLGYTKSIVVEILNDIDYDDSSAKLKEYDKLFKKYSKKYSGDELECKIKQSLYKNGFK